MMINGMSSQSRLITEKQRDSIYSKIQRGKINAERVVHLRNALFSCDSIKAIKTEIMGIQEIQIDSLYKVISIDKTIIQKLEEVVKLEIKRGRRRGFWNYLKGTAFGMLIMTVLTFII